MGEVNLNKLKNVAQRCKQSKAILPYITCARELARPRKILGSPKKAFDYHHLGLERPSSARAELAKGAVIFEERLTFRISEL